MVNLESAVRVDRVNANRGTFLALNDLSFELRAGSATALLGPNGAGKTTTFDVLTGQLPRRSGSVSVLGLDPAREWSQLASQVGVMTQLGGMYLSMSPRQALRLFGSYYPNPAPADELFELVGLDDRRQQTAWRQLSGGERQRLNLALALVGQPRVLLLDEPTAGLDPQGQQQLRDVLGELRSREITMLIATHDLADAESNVDTVCIIANGHVAYQGPSNDPQRNTTVVATLTEPLTPQICAALEQSCTVLNTAPPQFGKTSISLEATDAAHAQQLLSQTSQILAQHGLAARQFDLTGGRLADLYDRAVSS